jgi:hypothetical protein
MATEFVNWRKSSFSDADSNCVEVGESADRRIFGVRDTKNRDGGTLTITRTAWQDFLHGVRHGEFDL